MTKNELSKAPKEIKTYISGLRKREMDYYSIPEEYRNHQLIVEFERELGIRKPVKKGFDIINNLFFVEEAMTVLAL